MYGDRASVQGREGHLGDVQSSFGSKEGSVEVL